MTVSIIIAVKDKNPRLLECIKHCLELDYPDYDILVLPDQEIKLDYPKTSVIPTGKATPPIKRDMSIDKANGDMLAFIDDDAYPLKDWLTNAIGHFADPEIAAVGGPALTPQDDNLRQKASGLVYCSPLVSGPYGYRYLAKSERFFVDDYPSCNFIVRKSVMQQISGFNTKFWPGEDTFLCLKITRDLRKKIIYDPRVLVYHHRRSLFAGHLIQIANYGLHRGYFAKRFPGNSLRPAYFLPTLFVLGLALGGIFSLSFPALKSLYLGSVILYLIVVFIFSLAKDFRLTFLVFWGIIFSHIVYGLYFAKGLISQRLKEE